MEAKRGAGALADARLLAGLARVASVLRDIDGVGDIPTVLLDAVDVPLAIAGRPPDVCSTQAGKADVGDHLVARPAVVHVAERDLELAALGGLQVLGEDGAFLDVLVLGRARRLDVESIDDPLSHLGEAPNVLLLALDGEAEVTGLVAEAHVPPTMRTGARLPDLAPEIVLAMARHVPRHQRRTRDGQCHATLVGEFSGSDKESARRGVLSGGAASFRAPLTRRRRSIRAHHSMSCRVAISLGESVGWVMQPPLVCSARKRSGARACRCSC